MDYTFNLGVFAVPNTVVDNYIKTADDAHLKVLLYCLRHGEQILTAGEISRATGVPADSVAACLEFWSGVIGKENGVSVNSGTEKLTKAAVLLDREHQFSPIEISEVIKNSKDVEYLFKRGEELYGRPLKHREQQALSVIIEEAGMKPEVALMLLEFCFSIGKTATSYIKKTAKDWIEQGICSLQSAESEIKRLKAYYSVEGEIIRMLGVRDIPEAKKPLVRKWLYEYNLSNETIYDAYQKTLEKTGKLEYTYMDKILSGINQNGGNSSAKPSSKKPQRPPSFDLDEFDRQIMEKYKE